MDPLQKNGFHTSGDSWGEWKNWILLSIRDLKSESAEIQSSLKNFQETTDHSLKEIHRDLTRLQTGSRWFFELAKILSPFALFVLYDLVKLKWGS